MKKLWLVPRRWSLRLLLPVANSSVKIYFLGGLGEIGRNCMAIEQGRDILVVDAGLMFPEPSMYGIDIILPDFTWLIERADRVVGVVLTHGHEDHTGALRYLLRDVPTTIYGAPLTIGFAKHRLMEAKLPGSVAYVEVQDGETRKIGSFRVEFIPVTHSVPSAHALAITTDAGVIIHSGDFKFDQTPIDHRRSDIARLAALGDAGVRLLLADSTNAEQPGYTASESSVGVTLRRLVLERQDRRIVIACFASHLHRVQQILRIARESGRKVCLLGRSMEANVKLGRKLGEIDADGVTFVSADSLDDIDPASVIVVCTGSQGEPMAALSRLARQDDRFFSVRASDTIILSSHPIPGNEWSVGRVIDDLHRLGAEVIHSDIEPVHASGHARQGELKTLHQLIRPVDFIPIHGEYRQMIHHADLAVEMGLASDHVWICEDGDVMEVSASSIKRAGTIPAEYHYIDGGDGDTSDQILDERRMLAEHGVLQVAGVVTTRPSLKLEGVTVSMRGWFDGKSTEDIRRHCENEVEDALLSAMKSGSLSEEEANKIARKTVGRLMGGKYRRQPVVMTAIAVI